MPGKETVLDGEPAVVVGESLFLSLTTAMGLAMFDTM